jgi:hypothetical protein
VDALADFQRFGGEVDEVTSEDLAIQGPGVFGAQNGRSLFAITSRETGQIVAIITADGGAVKAGVTRDGFLLVQPSSAGFKTRNPDIFKALYPGRPVPRYTEEVIFEYIDESGARILVGGAEAERTTSYLFKKDPSSGEVIFRLNRDITSEKSPGSFLDPDVSSVFPTRVKVCDAKRQNCITRSIIKKPGDEIRIDLEKGRMDIVFNRDNLPFSRKYRNAQRLSWVCEAEGRGFFITYREGSLGGHRRPGWNDIGTLACRSGVLRCERTSPDQKCNFDFRDYLGRPAEAALFGLDWLLSRKDPHAHYFTLAPSPEARRHIRIGNLKNLDTIREVAWRPEAGATPGGDGSLNAWAMEQVEKALCKGSRGACFGKPSFKILEVTAVNDGVVLIDERTGTKLKGIEKAVLYSLREPYGWGKKNDFIAALITNREEAAEVAALTRLNEELEAPELLEKDDMEAAEPEDPVKAMLKGLEEEKKREVMRVKLAKATRALVIFPTTHIEEMTGLFGLPVTSPPPTPATILSLAPAEGWAPSPEPESPSRPRKPLPPYLP